MPAAHNKAPLPMSNLSPPAEQTLKSSTEAVFSWFRSLGKKQRGQWINVTSQDVSLGRKQWPDASAQDAAGPSVPLSRESPPANLGIVRSRSFSSSRTAETSAAPAGKHRRNQSDGTHVAKAWKQANEPVSLDNFSQEKVLGKGGFGKVMLVKKKDNKQLYALKVLRKADLIQRGQVEAVKTEHQLLHSMNHPFLTSLHFSWQTEDKLYLCMNYCPGGELFYIRQRQGVFTPSQVRLYVAEIALAVGALHARGFIYRDLKLENLLLDAEGHICLTDFGLAKQADRCTTFCGTPEYVAPEMIRGRPYSGAVDWWALGTLAYEMSTGVAPFFSRNQERMFHKIVKQPLYLPDTIAPAAQSLITGLMDKQPEARLGGGEGDVAEVQRHSFFEGLDWEKVLQKGYTPEFLPLSKASSDVSAAENFDPVFTSMSTNDSMTVKPPSDSLTANFGNFTYSRPESLPVGSPAA